jgi:predicted nucleic acid-binding protein
MNIFFDTSSFSKLYHEEEGTKELLDFLSKNPNYKIYLAEITMVEIYSAILKKVRIGHLSMTQAQNFLLVINDDFKRCHFIPTDTQLLIEAQNLIVKYGIKGLRSLDAIQLASTTKMKSSLDFALTGDFLLRKFLTEEGIDSEF